MVLDLIESLKAAEWKFDQGPVHLDLNFHSCRLMIDRPANPVHGDYHSLSEFQKRAEKKENKKLVEYMDTLGKQGDNLHKIADISYNKAKGMVVDASKDLSKTALKGGKLIGANQRLAGLHGAIEGFAKVLKGWEYGQLLIEMETASNPEKRHKARHKLLRKAAIDLAPPWKELGKRLLTSVGIVKGGEKIVCRRLLGKVTILFIELPEAPLVIALKLLEEICTPTPIGAPLSEMASSGWSLEEGQWAVRDEMRSRAAGKPSCSDDKFYDVLLKVYLKAEELEIGEATFQKAITYGSQNARLGMANP